MTLKAKTNAISVLAVVAAVAAAALFWQNSDNQRRLIEITDALSEIRHAAWRVNQELLKGRPRTAAIREVVQSVPEYTSRLHKALISRSEPAQLIELEIMFVRIGRIIGRELPDSTLEAPLNEQIANETNRIERTIDSLQQILKAELGKRQSRNGFLIAILLLAFVSSAFAVLLFVHGVLVRPVLELTSQIQAFRAGSRSDIDPPKRNDEIGTLTRFAREAISELDRRNRELGTEIGERERTAGRLRQSTRMLTNVLDSSNPICVCDLSHQVLQANRAYYEIWPTGRATDPNCRPSGAEAFDHVAGCWTREIAEGKDEVTYELKNVVVNGTPRCLAARARPHRDDNGELIGVVETYYDITDRRQAEEHLESERERLAVTLACISDGVITTDTEGVVVLVNGAAEELTGWRQAQAQSRGIRDVFVTVDERTREPRENPLSRVLVEAECVSLGDHTTLLGKNGVERFISGGGAPMIGRDGRTMGAVLVFRDVTEERRMQEERLKISKLESIGVLAGGIAHDFNNLLCAIMGNISLAVASLQGGGDVRGLLEDSEDAALRARDLTQQLLTFSRGGDPVKRRASIEEVVRASSEFVLRGTNVRCAFQFAEGLWPVEIDTGQMSQVIQNLVLNAKEAMPNGGTVKVVCEKVPARRRLDDLQAANHVKVVITDSGSGIAKEDLARVFDPYFSTKEGGSGLGLAICHAIIGKHNGHITVRSEPGVGSTFTIVLAAVTQDQSDVLAQDVEQVHEGHGRILVMDDEEAVRSVAAKMLARCGYVPITAKDGEEAIRRYQQNMRTNQPVDVVIMDLTVPGGMGGKEAASEIVSLDPGAKLIVASGHSNDAVMARYRDFGFHAALCKPYTMVDLIQAIEQVVQKRAAIPSQLRTQTP